LDVAQRDTGVERSGDERVPQRVGPDALGDPCLSGDSTHDPTGSMTVESLPGAVDEIGPSIRSPIARSTVRATRGASGVVTTLPPLRVAVSVR
jgi:hypothetical protein